MNASGARSGGAAEEAARLADVLQQAAAGWVSRAAAGGNQHRHGAGHEGGLPVECTVCPVCAALRRLSGVRPEVVHHLAEAAGSVAAALAELAADRPPPEPPPTDGTPGRERGAAASQRIDVTD